MKKLLLAALIFAATSCKKEKNSYCYTCISQVGETAIEECTTSKGRAFQKAKEANIPNLPVNTMEDFDRLCFQR